MRKTVFFLAALLIALPAASALAQGCAQPNILILLDISGSMKLGSPSRFSQAVTGINNALATTNAQGTPYDQLANWGLATFPTPYSGTDGDQTGYCWVNTQPGGSIARDVEFGLGNRVAINNYLNSIASVFTNGKSSSQDTPIYQALSDAAQLQAFSATNGLPNYILLVTDGQQDCIPRAGKDPQADEGDFNDIADGVYNSNGTESFDPTETANNITDIANVVFNLKNSNLNVAVYPVGFNISSTDTPEGAYTLNQIAANAGTDRTSTCNQTGNTPSASNNCYYKASSSTDLTTAIGAIIQQITTEVCDGIDNDCDGYIDNTPGTTTVLGQTCGSRSTACAAEGDACTCTTGDEWCDATIGSGVASWTACNGVGPTMDTCDGFDNDCDGYIDNTPGTTGNDTLTEDCSAACGDGTQVCDAVTSSGTEAWGICNVPNPIGSCQCTAGLSCGPAIASSPGCVAEGAACQCKLGTQQCIPQSGGGSTYGACNGAVGPGTETCTAGSVGIDDNCDGIIDNVPPQACMTPCGPGTQTCLGSTWSTCVVTNPPVEICDGIDNNCNGQIDEGCSCKEGDTRPCGTTANGCQAGIQKCDNGQWTQCLGGNQGHTETCNGIDDDCDGIIDNGDNLCPGGQTCVCGSCEPACAPDGTCANGGTCTLNVCQIDYCPGTLVCNAGKCGTTAPATVPLTTPVVKDPQTGPDLTKTGTVKDGCGCHDTTPAGGLLAIFAVLAPIVLRRRRRS